jgi:hypothetical protein
VGAERTDHHSDERPSPPEGGCRGPYAGAPVWFPRWLGRCVVIAASGPSAAEADFDLIRRSGAAVVAINATYRLAPFADLLYAADGLFWLKDEGARAFPGLKVTQSLKDARRYGLQTVKLEAQSRTMQFERFGEIGAGGNSGFQAVNLVAQTGAARIVLVGFDYSLARGVHWHGRHPPGMNNPSEKNVARWAADMDRAAPLLASLGVDVVNASPHSSLRAFPVRPLSECLT